MLSFTSCAAEGSQPATPACVYDAGLGTRLATAREASRGCRTTPSNGLKDLENPAMAGDCAWSLFFPWIVSHDVV